MKIDTARLRALSQALEGLHASEDGQALPPPDRNVLENAAAELIKLANGFDAFGASLLNADAELRALRDQLRSNPDLLRLCDCAACQESRARNRYAN